jgi:hypothetical protein
MRTIRLCSLIVCAAFALPLLRAEGPKQTPPDRPEKIEKLIQQLASDEFAERARAAKELEAIGEQALEALRRANASSDLEVRNGAQKLVERIENDMTTQAMLKPTRVRLNFKDLNVLEAVTQLGEQSGYRITITGETGKLKGSRITLDTGDTTFWEALDRLCATAGLVEDVPVVPPGTMDGYLADEKVKPVEKGITLKPGKAQEQATARIGSVRVRALPADADRTKFKAASEGETLVVLDIAAELRLQYFRVCAPPHIDRVIDDLGQELAVNIQAGTWNDNTAGNPGMGNVVIGGGGRVVIGGGGKVMIGGRRIGGGPPVNLANRNSVPVYLHMGAKAAESLREVSGNVSVEALAQERVATLDGILKAGGQKFTCKRGGEVDVKAVEQLKNGDVQVELTLVNLPVEEQRPDPPLPPNIVIARPAVARQERAKSDMPRLVDELGRPYDLVAVPTQKADTVEGKDAEVLTLVFHRREGQGEPARLVVEGRRWVTFDVPFTIKSVPLH